MAEEIDIKVNIKGQSIKDLKKSLAETKKQLEETTDPKEFKKLTKAFQEGTVKLSSYNKQLKGTAEATEEVTKSNKDLDATFEDIHGDLKPLSSRLGELEDRMYELALAGETNTEEFETMRMEAVRMRQTIIEVDKQVDILADNKGLGVFSEGLGSVGTSLANLDFDTAAKQAQSLATASGKISFKSAIGSFKKLGKTLMSLGKAILTNPLFLIAAIVAAIIAAIVALMDELGFLKVIFEAIGDAIGWVVQMLKDFLDWLGLTNYAEQDAAEESAKAAEKRAKAYEQASKRIIQALDTEIKLAEIAGENTQNLERKKLERIEDTTEAELAALRARLKAEKLKGEMDHEELVDLRNQVEDKKILHQQSIDNIKIFNAQEEQLVKDNLKAIQDAIDAGVEESNNKRKEAQDKYIAFRDQRISIEREIQDAETSLIQDETERQLKEIDYRFKRQIEDAKNNGDLLQEERIRLIELYGEQQIAAEKAIQDKIDAEAKKKREAEAEKAEADLKAWYAKKDALEISLIKDQFEREKAERTAQFEERIATLEAEGLLTNDIELQIKQKLQDDLDAIDKKAEEERKARDKQQLDDDKAIAEAKAQIAIDGLQLAASAAELFAGKSERAAKVAFNVQKAASIAQATMDGYKAVLSTYAQTPGGPILKGIAAGIAGGFAGIQIANIAKTKYEPGANSSGFSASSATPPQTPSFGSPQDQQQTPNLNLNDGIEQNAGGAVKREKVMVVDYTDIEDKGNELIKLDEKFTLA